MARSTVSLVLLALGLSLIAAPDSRAAFPGDNGRIGFSVWPPIPPENVLAEHGGVRQGLYVVEPVGIAVRPLKQAGSELTGWFSDPAWSPDGSKVAYIHHYPTTGRRAIEVMNADGSDGRVVVPALYETADGPAWSPDGSLIAFTRGDSVWTVEADNGESRRIVGRAAAPAWSPDCSRVAFERFGADHSEIRTVDASGRERSVVVGGMGPDWSPDGRHLVFWEYQHLPVVGRSFVRVIGADGSGERPLALGSQPAWSPDGREIVYETRSGLSAQPAEGGTPRTLTVQGVAAHEQPDWQPLRKTPLDPNLCAAWRRGSIQPSLELSVRPRRAVVDRATRFRLHVTTQGAPGAEGVPGAIVQFAGRRRSTDARGRTNVLRTFRRPGKRHLTAEKPGFFYGTTTVRVVRQR